MGRMVAVAWGEVHDSSRACYDVAGRVASGRAGGERSLPRPGRVAEAAVEFTGGRLRRPRSRGFPALLEEQRGNVTG